MSSKFRGYKQTTFKPASGNSGASFIDPKPTVVQIIPGDTDGLILAVDSLKDLDVEIPLWSNRSTTPRPDYLFLEWLPEGENTYIPVSEMEEIPSSVPVSDFPLKRVIPYRYFQNRTGGFNFRYRLELWNTSPSESEDTAILIDRLGPVFVDNEPRVAVSETLITDASLARDKGVICEIPDFSELRPLEVRAAVAWLDEIVDNLPDAADLDYFGLLPDDRLITIPEAKLRALGSGLHYVLCVLIDKAGNESKLTFPTEVVVALGELPNSLQPPTVPQADVDGITRQDAFDGVKVHVAPFLDYEENDSIVIDWGGERTAPITISQLLPFDLKVPVPWSLMKGLYDFTEGGDQKVSVKYEVLRGVHPISSSAIDIQANFAYAGPENPDEPDPVNRTLTAVSVWGASNIKDALVASDEGKDATAKINLYDSPKVGDVLTVFWNGVALSSDPYTVTGSESANQEIEFVVPWNDISPNPINLELPVYYTIAVPGSKNPQFSLNSKVNVQAVKIVLDEAQYETGGIGMYVCSGLIEVAGEWGVNVLIPPSEYLKEGVDLSLAWRSYYSDGLTEIPGTSLIMTKYPVSKEDEQDGILWFIPYEKHLKPTYGGEAEQYGYGRAQYQIVILGEPVPSNSSAIMIAMGRGGSPESCEIPPPRPIKHD